MKYFRNFTLSVLLMLIGTMGIKAQTVGLEEAEQKALAFVKRSNKAKTSGMSPTCTLSLAYTSKAGDETYYYVFNNGQDGYVIIGGDEVANDVLGYSESRTFCYDKLPDNMKWFLSCYDHQISAAIKQVKAGKVSADDIRRAKRAPRKAKANISYLLQTQWDQVAPYNSQIPLYSQGFTGIDALATGCVATAGAQVMKYHNWPDRGVGSNTLGTLYNGLTFSADFGSTDYDWSNMQNTYDPYDTYTGSAADIAVGTLMYHVGVAVDMEYGQLGDVGSASDTRDLAMALVNNFKYSKGITFRERMYYTDEQWEDMVYNELAASRPVLYDGTQESGSAHAFVCDGYRDGLYHINWGWSGQYDDYFLLTPTAGSGTALCPNGSGSGGGVAGKGYYLSQRICIGITPDRDGTSQPVKSAFTSGITLVTTSTSPEGNIIVAGKYCCNESMVAQSYNLKMKFTNTADESDVTIGTYIRTTSELPHSYAESSDEPFTAPSTLVPGQSYYVTMMYENSQGEYVDMPQPQDREPQVLSITEPEPRGIVLKELFVDNAGYITMDSFNFKAKVKNNTSSNWSRTYLKCQIQFTPYQIVSVYSEPFKFYSGEEATVTFDIYDQYGSYFPYFYQIGDKITTCVEDYDGNEISEPITFQFCEELPINYTLTSAEWGTLCLPYTAEVPEGLTAYTVTGTEGSSLVKEEVSTLEMNKPYLITGTPGSYPFNGPHTPEAENLKNGLLVGNTTAAQTYAPQASYVLQNLPAQDGLAFYEVQNDGTQKVRKYGAYLSAIQGTSATSFRFKDEENTGIATAEPSATTSSPAYNLNGMRVDRTTRGFVIVNGKLIYNK